MKFSSILFVLFVTITTSVSAQKSGLINSGELIKEGITLYDSSDYKKAFLVLDKVTRSDTNYVWALYEKALTCEADSQYTQAIKYSEEALALKDDRQYEPDLYNVYGNTLSDMQQYDKALKVFDTGIAKYPHYSLLYFNKGVVYLAKGMYSEAEQMFQKTLLINPYMYSAHYQLSLAAINQGKIVPAFLSSVGYLLVNPSSKYSSKAINILSRITKSTDEILNLKNKRKESPDANYQTVEEIVLSKIALDDQYKPIIKLDDPISRQIQVIFEKLEYDDKNPDFYVQYYLPYYKQVYKNGKLEQLVYQAFSNVNIASIQDYNKKNKKDMDAFTNEAADYFNQIRQTQELMFTKRPGIIKRYVYDNGKLVAKGELTNNGKTLVGPWEFYYSGGNIKSIGNYSATGGREGVWLYYHYDGTLKSKENYKAGKTEGIQEYYHENGNLSSREVHVADKLQGQLSTFYYAGGKRREVRYKAGVKDGEEREYHANGNLSNITNYANGQLSGVAKEYYKSGALKNEATYVADKAEGTYKTYYESGKLSSEMQFVKGKLNGEWKAYYQDGKIKGKRTYINGNEDGAHLEYYNNGQLSMSLTAKGDKENGEALYYSKNGKIEHKATYINGVIKAAKYFDAAGKQISASEMKGNTLDLLIYNGAGAKTEHVLYNEKGEITGADTIFYSSGKIQQISQYKNGEQNGMLVSYYLNGKKKSQVNMTAGKEDGYYESYYVNGQPEAEGWIREGEYQGEWVYYDIHGKVTAKANYLDSDNSGYREEYDPNGQKKMEQKYHSGWLEKVTQYDGKGKVLAECAFPKGSGKYTLMHPNGQVMVQVDFVNGNFNGLYKSFYFDGSPENTLHYKGGLLDSTYTSYFYGGNKYVEGKYHMGNRTGQWKTYDDDGKLSKVANYITGELNGEHIYYNPDGSKDFVSIYKDNDLNGTARKYDPDGSLGYEAVFEDDKIEAYNYTGKDGKLVPLIPVTNGNGVFKAYFPNGKPSRECTYVNGEKNGPVTIYYSSGQVRSVDTEEYGVSEGVSKEFYADGKLKWEYSFASDYIDGLSKEYNKNGTLKRETVYLAGDKHGPEKKYDENGKLAKTLVYEYGKLMSVKNEK